MTYQEEVLDDNLIEEMLVWRDEYWNETTRGFHEFRAAPKWEVYKLAQRQGQLKVVTAREDGVLMGGAMVVVMPDLVYECVSASIPLIFMAPFHRKGTEGMRLVKEAEKAAKRAGAEMISTHGGMHNGVYKLFEYMKYKDFGRYFVKTLEAN